MRKLFFYLGAIWLWTFVAFSTVLMAMGVLLCAPFVIPFDRQRHSLHLFGIWWARMIFAVSPWRVTVAGRENLAKNGEAVVYVANHLSQADILVTFLLNSRFRWLSKKEVFDIPFMGWAMRTIGYVAINRSDRRSQEKSMRQLAEHIKNQTPVFFFPEGTRSRDGVLKPFKSGAFRLASRMKVPVVPITFVGTDKLLPKGTWRLNIAHVDIVIHPRIESTDKTSEELAEQAFNTVASALPLEKRGKAYVAGQPEQ